jgi:signal transduction histidine kinase
MKPHRLTLLWKIWLSTSVALTLLFGLTGFVLQRQFLATTAAGLDEEVKASFRAYESVWTARAEILGATAAILSSTPNVRAAFGTRDPATIRDTAGEVWTRVADRIKETSFFLVIDPQGATVASLDAASQGPLPARWPVVEIVRREFPKQVSGFFEHRGNLFQLVLTPVYVDSPRGPVLINVLLSGFVVNHLVAQRLKESTGGSDFLFVTGSQVVASTVNDRATGVLAASLSAGSTPVRISDGVSEYAPLVRDLIGLDGKPLGKLGILRSFEGANQRVAGLRRLMILIWLLAVSAGLALTYLLARRIVRPVETLDRAAAEVARQNYDFRVPVESRDEFGRLASTFNAMCASLQDARRELIRQERISTIGRMASSIVHDLRNPLAAIYGGAEMMVDTDLPPNQIKRLAANIYRASRRIQEMLNDLVNISRGKTRAAELCRLRDVIDAAVDSFRTSSEAQGVRIHVDVPPGIELPLERGRIERVFLNLIGNSLEAMPDGGEVRVIARLERDATIVEVLDTGPGISREIRDQLFQPFVSFGKKNGLGLGLALARQTVLDHGGDMWAGDKAPGAQIFVRLPLAPKPVMAAVS